MQLFPKNWIYAGLWILFLLISEKTIGTKGILIIQKNTPNLFGWRCLVYKKTKLNELLIKFSEVPSLFRILESKASWLLGN
ncbi:hypothetical protein Aoki45_07380 [Algoriphagus sp. oki45]|nr:hypothetical protein Aoki45_07380 [Algoriphagus sp. oki45]